MSDTYTETYTLPRKHAPRQPSVMKACNACGKTFKHCVSTTRAQLKHTKNKNPGRFCSQVCYQEYRRRPGVNIQKGG